MPNANCLLLTAKYPLPTVYCHMPIYCQLSTAKNQLPNAHCCCCLLLCSPLCNREDASSYHQQPIRKQSTRSEKYGSRMVPGKKILSGGRHLLCGDRHLISGGRHLIIQINWAIFVSACAFARGY